MNRIVTCLAVAIVLLSSPLVRAEASLLSDQQIAAIRTGCQSGLQGVRLVQETEAASRVNRGQVYESTLRLMSALNSRLALNKIDAGLLTSSTANAQKKLDLFHQHYLDYASKMDQTLAINCKDAPVSFYDSLTRAREARALVAKDIVEIDNQLNEYQKGLDQLKVQLTPSGQTTASQGVTQ